MFSIKKVLYFLSSLVLLLDNIQCKSNLNHGKLVSGLPVKEGEFSPMFVKVIGYIHGPYFNDKQPRRISRIREESGGIIINREQVLVPASVTIGMQYVDIDPYIHNPESKIRFSMEKTCVMNRFGELDVGEKDLVQNQKPTIYDLAVLNLDRVLDNYPPNTGDRFSYALPGKIPLEPGDAVTILSVGKDLAGKEHGPRKLSASVIACPKKLHQEKVFCLDAHYACQSDKGSVVFKGNGSDGRVYGMITYSANCDPAKGLVAVRAMDLVRLQRELTELTKICLPHAKPLEFECWNLNQKWGDKAKIVHGSIPGFSQQKSFIRVEQRSIDSNNSRHNPNRTLKTCGGLILSQNLVISTANCMGTGSIRVSPVVADTRIEKFTRTASYKCSPRVPELTIEEAYFMRHISIAFFDSNHTIPLGVYPGCQDRASFLGTDIPKAGLVDVVGLGRTESKHFLDSQMITQAVIFSCRQPERFIICLESYNICPSDEGAIVLVDAKILGVVIESNGCSDGRPHTIKAFNLVAAKSLVDKMIDYC